MSPPSLHDCDASVREIGACPAFSDGRPGLTAVSNGHDASFII